MKQILSVILIYILCCNHISAQKNNTPCDTLVFRDVCGYCEDPSANTEFSTCLCYSYLNMDSLNYYIQPYSKTIKVLIIENPSNIINLIDFSNCTQLKNIIVFGNDSDALTTIPEAILNLPSIKEFHLNNVSLEDTEKKRIQLKYPSLKLSE